MTASGLFWLAVGMSGLAGAVVLIGIGYLLGRRAALREAVQALQPLSQTIESARRAAVLQRLAEER